MRRQIGTLFVLSAFVLHAVPVYSFTGTEGAAFLELPVGARPAALGQAYSALAEDAYAPTWNPAGLAFLDNPQVAAMHMIYLESTTFEYGSFAMPLGKRAGLGFSVQYFNPGAITGLDETGTDIGHVSGYSASYTAATGFAVTQMLGIGLSGHLIQTKIDDVSAQSIAGGAGLLFRPGDKWRFALVADNYGEKLKLLESEDQLPLVYRAGAAFHPTPSWTIALEGVRQVDDLDSFHSGVEYETPFGFSVRTGYNTERTRELSTIAGFSLGVSMYIAGQDFAYTWLPLSELGSSHLLSVVWRFGKQKPREEDAHQMKRPPKEEEMNFKLD